MASHGYVINTTYCKTNVVNKNVNVTQGLVPSIELHETLLLVTGFGIFTTLIACLFIFIRTKIYKDKVRHISLTMYVVLYVCIVIIY